MQRSLLIKARLATAAQYRRHICKMLQMAKARCQRLICHLCWDLKLTDRLTGCNSYVGQLQTACAKRAVLW